LGLKKLVLTYKYLNPTINFEDIKYLLMANPELQEVSILAGGLKSIYAFRQIREVL